MSMVDVLPTEMAGFCAETSDRIFTVMDVDGESAVISILTPVTVNSWPEIAKAVESCLAAMYKPESNDDCAASSNPSKNKLTGYYPVEFTKNGEAILKR